MDNNYLDEISWQALTETIGELHLKEIENAEPSEYWHYTTLNTLESIFHNAICTMDYFNVSHFTAAEMYASNIRYLNDTQEYCEGKDKFKEFAKNTALDDAYIDNVYLISFCGNGDLLSQWKYYGKESGVAVKFNLDKVSYRYWTAVEKPSLNNSNKLDPFEYLTNGFDGCTKPLSVKYSSEDKEKYYKELLKIASIAQSAGLRANIFIPFCKNEKFCDEQESRLVFYAHKFDVNQSADKIIVPNIIYNFGKSTIKPALRVGMFSADKTENIIDKIVVGPGFNQTLIFNALIHMFDRPNYHFSDKEIHRCENGIEIKKSEIPFRGD